MTDTRQTLASLIQRLRDWADVRYEWQLGEQLAMRNDMANAADELERAALSAQPVALPMPGSPEASAMIDSMLARYEYPANAKNAARAGYEAARALLAAPQPQAAPAPEPSAQGEPVACQWCCGTRRFADHDCRFCAGKGSGSVFASAPSTPPPAVVEAVPLTDEQIDSLRGLDTAGRVRFYEHDFYVLSNFSAFTLVWKGIRFDTSEAAYHFEKFSDSDGAMADVRAIQCDIRTAPSAHEAFKIAERNRSHRRADWDDVKVGIMLDILRAKATQHEYVRRKLLATGDRELVEDSWRDDFWGWGPNRDGKNMLGRLWMQVRSELRGIAPKAAQP